MKYKQYSPALWQQLEQQIELALKNDSQPVAAFDADGTLWDLDLGENFFNYQIDHKLVPLPEAAFNHYEEMKKINNDPRSAYLWLAAINDGVPVQKVREWAAAAVQASEPIPFFEDQKKLIDLLKSKGVLVYVVTASVKWAVEAGAAKFFGIPEHQVLGVSTKVEKGLITSEQEGVITYRQGKVEALLQATQGKKPFLCSGNTMGDFELLKSATQMALAVSAANQDDRLYRTERDLQTEAQKNNWASHRFI